MNVLDFGDISLRPKLRSWFVSDGTLRQVGRDAPSDNSIHIYIYICIHTPIYA